MTLNVSMSREGKASELAERMDRLYRWAEGFDTLADTLERFSLPVVDFEDVRAAVVLRLRIDADRKRSDADRVSERLDMMATAARAAEDWHRRR